MGKINKADSGSIARSFVFFKEKESPRLQSFYNGLQGEINGDLKQTIADLRKTPSGRNQLIEKIYNSLVAQNIAYDKNQYDPSELKQVIRDAEEMLGDNGTGTCIDLTILFCTICFNYRLLPILILYKDHVFAAVSYTHELDDWSGECFQDGLLKDKKKLKEIVKQGYLVIECTGFARKNRCESDDNSQDKKDNNLTFEQAIKAGNDYLNNPYKEFRVAFDLMAFIHEYGWWRLLCRERLEKEILANVINNPSINREGLFESLYISKNVGKVRLGKKILKSKDNLSAEEGSQLYDTDPCTEEDLKHDEFFTDYIEPNNNPNKEGKRLAIIGEPGIGKTWLLQQIAKRLIDKKQGIPIWISLASCTNIMKKNDKGELEENQNWLHDYLYKTWLKNVAEQKAEEATLEEWTQAFDNLLNSGSVWLLLDGADEMSEPSPLSIINRQVTGEGWTTLVTVVLTCRSNLWEENKTALEQVENFNGMPVRRFDIYRPQQFNKTNIDDFIKKWFDANPGSGSEEKLHDELRTNQRLNDLVKNPLRLGILCSIWKDCKNQLPDTKAGLYKIYTERQYELKEDSTNQEFRICERRQNNLNKVLGELAKWLLSQPTSRFCIRLNQIPKCLSDKLVYKDDEHSLLWLALKLGWLNPVGFEQDKNVYAFFHTTLQEYFAATAIDDWDYFLPRNHDRTPVKDETGNDKPYRIFDRQWKEAILLWLGRSENEVTWEKKKDFIEKLKSFEDDLENFYGYRAYFLAAEGIAEIHNDDEIIRTDDPNRKIKLDIRNLREQIKQTIQEWSKGNFKRFEKSPKKKYIEPIARAAIATLPENNHSELQANLDIYIRKEVEKRKETALNIAKINAAPVSLENNIHSGNLGEREIEEIVEAAKHLKENSPVLWKVIERLGEDQCKGKAKAIEFLRSKIVLPKDAYIFWKSAYNLAKIVGNTEDINRLRRIFRLSEANLRQVAKIVEALYVNSNEVLPDDGIKNLISLVSFEYFPLVVTYLKPYLKIDEHPDLPETESYSTLHRFQLLDYLFDPQQSESERFRDCYKTLWYCAQIMSYPDFYEAWIKQPKSVPEILQELYPGQSVPKIVQELYPALSLPNILPRLFFGQSLREILQELCPGLLEILQEFFPDQSLQEILQELFPGQSLL
jgi:hypothetical protein